MTARSLLWRRALSPLGRLVIAVVLLIGLPATGLGNPPQVPMAQPGHLIPASDSMSLNQATRMVREETGGRILSAEEVQRGNRSVYRIRVLLDEGRVRVVEVDPGTGRMR